MTAENWDPWLLYLVCIKSTVQWLVHKVDVEAKESLHLASLSKEKGDSGNLEKLCIGTGFKCRSCLELN